jgi:hypothetical protein
VIGKTGEHASLFVKALTESRHGAAIPRSLRLLGWGWAERLASLPVGAAVDVIIEPKISTWNGASNVEGELIDLREAK